MAEHRDPGTGGEPDQPERDPQQHDDSEPEFGSSEWLLAQLTGGRRVERADETVGATTGVAPEGEREEDGAGVGGADGGEVAPETSESTVSSGDEPAFGAFDDLLREPTASGEDVGAPAAQPVPLDFADLLRDVPAPTPDESADDDVATTPIATAPQGFVWNLTSRQDGERDDTVASAPSAEPDRTSAFGAERPTEEASAPEADAPEADAEDATPPVRRTNFVEPQSRPARETPAAESAAASGLAAGSAPAAQPEVPAAQTRPAQTPPAQTPAAPAQGFEPPSFVAALRMPRPPEWGDAPSSPAEPPAGSDSSDSVAPAGEGLGESRPNVDEPEAEPKPPTNDTEPLHGHGLAALLGAYQDERPAPRPLLGDTTGIIPLPPTYIPPAPPAPPTQTPPPTTPAVATPETVTPEMVSPGAGTSGSDANPAPVTRREALRAEGETAPGAFVPPALSEPAPPAPVLPPDEGPFDEAAQTEAILGAPPSPATSPFDAAALAAASAEVPTAAVPVGDVPAAPEPAQPVGRAAGELNDAGEADGHDEPDGIAALFGDFALADGAEGTDDDSDRVHEVGSPVVDESQPAAESAPAASAAAADADTPAPANPAAPADRAATAQGGSLGIDAILFPELAGDAQASREADPDAADASLPEPAAALEGPQLGAEPGAGFGLDDFDTAAPPTVAFDAAAAAREPLAAPTPPSPATTPVDSPAAGPAAGPAATAAWAAAGPSASTAPATRPTSPSSTPPSSTPPPSTPPTPSDPPRGPRDPRLNRRIYLIAGVLAVLLVLVGLFALGTRIPALFGASAPSHPASASRAASATPTPTPTPTPTVIQKPAAAVGPGEHAWDTLGGGECIQPYTSPWAETFTVVDCTADHSAQMVYTNLLSADPAAPYPGADALAQQINTLCTAGGVVDLNAAAAYPDLQVQGTFPATDAQWKSGQRSYYCFASRSSGQPLSTSVQGQGPTG